MGYRNKQENRKYPGRGHDGTSLLSEVTKRFLANGKAAPGPDEINNKLIKRMPVAFHKMVVNAFIEIWNL
eukprot:7265877-Pyramimonas_sp.AAC.1